jgi:hypothetical protein
MLPLSPACASTRSRNKCARAVGLGIQHQSGTNFLMQIGTKPHPNEAIGPESLQRSRLGGVPFVVTQVGFPSGEPERT